jgi:hypothetical protein
MFQTNLTGLLKTFRQFPGSRYTKKRSNALLIKLVQIDCSYRYILSNLALGFIDPRYLRGIRWIEFNQANLELIIVVFLGPPVRE